MKLKHLSMTAIVFLAALVSYGEAIRGYVRDAATGKGLPGVLVSNCREVARTAADGSYSLPENPKTNFVTVVTPANYRTDSFYQRVSPDAGRRYDFSLQPKAKLDSFDFLQLSDTEEEGNSAIEGNRSAFQEFARNLGAAFVINTGDIHTPDDQKKYAELIKTGYFGCPLYTVQGNHDLKTPGGRGETCYEDTLGPLFYAFEEGNVLFIVLPMVESGDNKPSFTRADIAAFAAELLRKTPRSRPVVFFAHSAEIINADGVIGADTPTPVNTARWNVKGWILGHLHDNYTFTIRTGLKFFVPSSTNKGPGHGQFAGFRSFHVDREGNLVSASFPTYVKDLFDLQISPAPGREQRTTLAAAVMDSRRIAERVELAVEADNSAPETVALTRRGGWLWSAEYPFETGNSYRIHGKVFWNSGEVSEKEFSFPQPSAKTHSLTLERVAILPGGTLQWGAPVIKNGVLYVGTCDEDNGVENAIYALNSADGTVVWRRPTAAGVSNRVVFSDGVVYAADLDSNLYAVDAATGNPVWYSPAGRKVNVTPNRSGIAVSDGLVFGGHASEALRAVDAGTGKIIWTACRKSRGTSINPLIVVNGKLIVGDGVYGEMLVAYDLKTGRVVWSRGEKHRFGLRTLLLNERELMAIGTFGIWIVDVETGRTLQSTTAQWQADEPHSATDSLPLVTGDRIFLAADDGMGCYDRKPPFKIRWSSLNTGNFPAKSLIATLPYCLPGRYLNSTPIGCGGNLIFAGLDGVLYECAADDGKLLGRIALGAPVNSSPAIADGRLYLFDCANRLFIFRLSPEERPDGTLTVWENNR